MSVARLLSVCATTLLLATPAFAQSTSLADAATPIDDDAIFVLGGAYSPSTFDQLFWPFNDDYESNYVLGAGYQHFFLDLDHDIRFGTEVGAAIRFGEKTTGEAWAGVVTRYDGLVIADTLRIAPSLTFGLSAVTDTMGREAEREIEEGGSSQFVFYLSPEISFSNPDHPELEAFWRLQHRSSAWGTLGVGSGNATTVGLRYHF